MAKEVGNAHLGIMNANVNEDGSVATALTTGSTATAAKVAAFNASHPDDPMTTYERMINALGYRLPIYVRRGRCPQV